MQCKTCANERYDKILDDFVAYAKSRRDLAPKDTAWLDDTALSFKRSASRTGIMTVDGSKGKLTCVREEATGLASTFFFECPCYDSTSELKTSKPYKDTQMFETNMRASYAALNIER